MREQRAIPSMNDFEKHKLNDRTGLNWVHRFGWIRTAELGAMLWPSTAPASATRQANRIVKSWVKRGLVIERELPDRAGRALVLAQRGVDLLTEHDVKAATGKDIGKLIAEPEWHPPLKYEPVWLPPKTWRHDLLAAGILAELHRQGWAVFPEREIRQRSAWLAKLPDGLAVRGTDVAWIEVERSHKTGPEGRNLRDALVAVGAGEAASVLGHRPTVAMVAYEPSARDSRGCAIDHRARITNAVSETAKKPVAILWAACTLRGPAGLGTVKFERETIGTDRAAGILKRMSWQPDPAEEGVLVAGYSQYLARVWEDEYGWSYQIDERPAGYADNMTAAKRACADEIAGL